MRPLLKYTLSLFSFFLIALGSNAQTPLIHQLTSVNAHWQSYTKVSNELIKTYKNLQHEEKIKLHLEYVEKILREKNTQQLSSQQRTNRNKSLDVLKQYYRDGVFPQNTNHPNEIIPYFIDKYNTACAVGHLIRESGNTLLPNKIHTENNYGYIKELIKIYPEINSWASTNGFTIDELAWIQPQYGPCKYNYEYPVVFSDSNYIHPSRCTTLGFGCSNPYEDGYFTIDSNSFPGLTLPLVGTFHLQPYVTVGTNPFYQPNMRFREGTYEVIVTDANNITQSQLITIPSLQSDVTYSIQSTDLTHGVPGRIVVNNFSGGTGLYTALINRLPNAPNSYVNGNNLQSSDSVVLENIIIGGDYLIIVKDQNLGCELVDTVHLSGSLGLLDSLSDPTFIDSVKCYIDSGIVVYTGYNTSTNYSITDTFIAPSATYISVVSFTDSANLTSNFGVVYTYPQYPFEVYKIVTPANCSNPNGSVTINAPNAPQPVTNTGTFIKPPGSYLTTLTSADGCNRNVVYTINNLANTPIELTSDSILYTCQGQVLSINPTFTGGVPPYTFSPNQLPLGMHTLTVMDSSNCIDSVNIHVKTDSIYYTISVLDPICPGDKGIFYISASNSLNSFSLSDTFSMPSGNHQYILTDSLGCKDTVHYTVNSPNPKIVVSSPTTLIKCKELPYNFTPSFAGGAPPYSFSPNNLSLGTQQIYITDNANCIDSALFHLQESDIGINIVVTDSIKCNGEVGECEIVGIGSHTPFTGVGKISYTADSVYNFTISDNAGCLASTEKTFYQPEKIFLSNEKTSMDLFMKGAYTTEANGGTPPYKYQLEGATNNAWESVTSNNLTIDNLTIGKYTLRLRDANDCAFEKPIIIGENINTTKAVSIFPNPFTNRIFVLLNDTYKDVRIRIFNANGQNFYNKKFAELKQQDIPLTLAAGMYFVEISSPELSTQVVKIAHE